MQRMLDTISSPRGHDGVARQPDHAHARTLCHRLARTLNTPTRPGDARDPDAQGAGILRRLLAINDQAWPLLARPDRLTLAVTREPNRFDVLVESTDDLGPSLEIRFDADGRLIAWRPRAAEPIPLMAGLNTPPTTATAVATPQIGRAHV